MRWAFALGAAVSLAACSAPADLGKATAAVADFRQKQAAGDDETLYRELAPQFKQAMSEPDFKRLDDVVRAALARGCAAPPPSPTSWNVNYGTNGQVISLVYDRSCADGDLSEQFVYVIDHGEAKLAGYHVSGMALFPPANAQEPAATSTTTTSTSTTTGATTAPAAPEQEPQPPASTPAEPT